MGWLLYYGKEGCGGGGMCLNQGALSCGGTHFIKPSSWGRRAVHTSIIEIHQTRLQPVG